MFGMSFLNPLLLWGALAAAGPLMLHLLRRQRYRDLPFSSLIFLSSNLRRQLRASRLTHLLLLLLRMALLICLSVAIAGPMLAGRSTSRRAVSVAFVIDSSASMGVRWQGKTAFERAVATVLERVDAATSADHVSLVLASRRPAILMVDQPGGREDAERILRDLEPTALAGDLAGGAREALAILSQSELATRRLVLVTDGQEAYDPRPEASTRGVEVEQIRLAPPTASNLYVDTLAVPQLSRVRADRRISMRVVNAGSARALGTARLNLDGAYLGERSLDLRAGASADLRFDVAIDPGLQTGFVELVGDDLAVDNRRFFVLGLDARMPVGVVGPSDGRRFVELALGAEEESARGGFDVHGDETVPDIARMSPPPRAVVLTDLKQFDAEALQSLAKLRAGGTGILIFLGPGTIPSLVNETIAGSAILPLRLSGRETGSWTAAAVASRHSALPGDSRLAGMLSSTEFRERQRFVALGQGADPLLTYSDGEALLVELRGQSPPLFVFSAAADRSGSDFVLSPYFVLLLRRTVDLLGGIRDRAPLPVGADLPQASAGAWRWTEKSKDLAASPVATAPLGQPGALIHWNQAGAADDWREVAVDPSESHLDYPAVAATKDESSTAGTAGDAHSVAFPFAMLALFLFIAESVLTVILSGREAIG